MRLRKVTLKKKYLEDLEAASSAEAYDWLIWLRRRNGAKVVARERVMSSLPQFRFYYAS